MADIFDELRDYCKKVIKYGSVKPTIKIKEGVGIEAIIKRGDEEIILRPKTKKT